MNYYNVIGKNKHIPISYNCKAVSVASAKIAFYCDTNGTDISNVIKTNKPRNILKP